jgi:hypothetical protein
MFARGRPVRSIPVVFSSWKDDPTTELVTAVGAAVRPYLGNGGMPTRAGGPLDEVIDAAVDAAGADLLIMVDQFEEYFLYRSREPVSERFVDVGGKSSDPVTSAALSFSACPGARRKVASGPSSPLITLKSTCPDWYRSTAT